MRFATLFSSRVGMDGGRFGRPVAIPVPCTILDPFRITGTTGVVAMRLNRAVYRDRIEDVEMARRRILTNAPLPNIDAVKCQCVRTKWMS